MQHESTNRNQSPPPMVTHSPYLAGQYPTMHMPPVPQPPTFYPAPPRKRGLSMNTAAAAGTCIAVVALAIGFVVGTTTGSTPASCAEALEHADTLTVLTSELGDLSAEAINAAAAWDADALESITVDVEDLTVRWDDTYAAYETARDDCEAGR